MRTFTIELLSALFVHAILFCIVWKLPIFESNREGLIKFLNIFVILLPIITFGFLQSTHRIGLSLESFYFVLDLFLFPLIWCVFWYSDKDHNIHNFFISMTLDKFFHTLLFVFTLYIDDLFDRSLRTPSIYLKHMLKSIKAVSILYLGFMFEFKLDFFVLGVFILSFKETFFLLIDYRSIKSGVKNI